MDEYLRRANTRYNNVQEVTKFKKWVDSDPRLAYIDQSWADLYMQPLIDFMGDFFTLYNFDNTITVLDNTKLGTCVDGPTLGFSDGHWYARKRGDIEAFDSYNEYQVRGTHQFCQTYALMYHTGKLPDRIHTKWTKYYSYTFAALHFIKTILTSIPSRSPVFYGATDHGNRLSKKRLLTAVNQCIKYPNACVNIIEYPRL